MIRHRLILILAALALAFLPGAPRIHAQEPDGDQKETLASLLEDLKTSYATALEADSLMADARQYHEELARIVKEADELTLKLYSQNPEFSFDMAFALEDITNMYQEFHDKVDLSENLMNNSKAGLRRYTLLGETLRGMISPTPADTLALDDSLVTVLPPMEPVIQVDSVQAALIDSCLCYTEALTGMYKESVAMAVQDSLVYANTDKRLQQAREYAQSNYDDSQKNLFIDGKANIGYLIKNWNLFILNVKQDLKARYHAASFDDDNGYRRPDFRTWDGTYILSYSLIMLFLLILAFFLTVFFSWLASRFIKNEKFQAFRPLLAAILNIVLYILLMLLLKPKVDNQYWKMSYDLLSQFTWLTLAIFISLLIRIDGSQAKASRNIYMPTLVMAFLIILMRAIFLPASLVPLVFPPALVLFMIWQAGNNVRYRKTVEATDRRYCWTSVGAMAIALIASLAGYAMVGVLLLTFWTFQLALLHTITTIYYLIKRYYENRVAKRKVRYMQDNPRIPIGGKYTFIEVTWLYDLLSMVVIPIAIIWSIPAGIVLTSKVYRISSAGESLFSRPLFAKESFQYLTLNNIFIILALFFIFRYIIYLSKSLFRINKLRSIIENDPRGHPLKEKDVNLSLLNTLLSVLGWLIFFVIVFSILHVPTSALTIISTGLAAGLGFAMKDTINNFFYGIQLMAGRIRVGDKISCDGVRGIVQRVSYLTTQIEEEDGSLIAFTNTDLFTKNFKNLNSGKNYELLKIPVTVSYGTDLEKARKVILEALEPLMTKDKFGRDVIDPSFGVDIRLDHFGDSAVNLFVVLYSTVETHYTFPARALEAIYNAFSQNGIEIPFNQHDIYIKSK